MGWSAETITLHISLDAHGGDKQERHDAIYEDFKQALRNLCLSEPFKQIVNEWSLPEVE
jgi:hypothetical protein